MTKFKKIKENISVGKIMFSYLALFFLRLKLINNSLFSYVYSCMVRAGVPALPVVPDCQNNISQPIYDNKTIMSMSIIAIVRYMVWSVNIVIVPVII